MSEKPTSASYDALLEAYDYFNRSLFGGQLPPVLLTYHRQRKVMGYASIGRWVNNKREYVDELAVNPEYFAKYPLMEICQTLCHEMVHIWQAHHGTPSRRGYHNAQWAQKMTLIGLMPSATGKPGGAKLGEWLMDYVLLDGAFHKACRQFLNQGFSLPWVDRYPIFRLDLPVLAFDDAGIAVELDHRLNPKAQRAVAAMKSGHAITSTAVTVSPPVPMSWPEPVARDLPPDFSEPLAHFKDSPNDAFEEALLLELNPRTRPKSGRVKYTCKVCHIQVWGKPGLNLGCNDCDQVMREVI
ncbi:MAG: zinc metalloprotease [Gammaproteobacteria bacterium]|nr:MAG: zinc metalloprotease [Gammaproteobacteria bacterium]